VALGGDFELVGAYEEHAHKRREVASQRVVDDETPAQFHGCFLQQTLINAAITHTHIIIIIMVA